MKKLILLLIILLLGTLYWFKFIDTGGARYVVVPADSTALLIDDLSSVREVASLFNLNYHHKSNDRVLNDCAYLVQNAQSYKLVGRETDASYLYGNRAIDEHLHHLFLEAERHSSHFIYSVFYPVEYDKNRIIELFQQAGVFVLVPPDEKKRRPNLSVKFTQNNVDLQGVPDLMEQKKKALQDNFKDAGLLEITGFVDVVAGTINSNQIQMKYTLYFQTNNQMNAALMKLMQTNSEVEQISVMHSGMLLLLLKDKDITNVSAYLKRQYPFVSDVRRYHNH